MVFDGFGIYLIKMKLGLHVSQISAMLPPISVYQCKKMVNNERVIERLFCSHLPRFAINLKSGSYKISYISFCKNSFERRCGPSYYDRDDTQDDKSQVLTAFSIKLNQKS